MVIRLAVTLELVDVGTLAVQLPCCLERLLHDLLFQSSHEPCTDVVQVAELGTAVIVDPEVVVVVSASVEEVDVCVVAALSETVELEASVVVTLVVLMEEETDVVEVWSAKLVELTILSQFASR